MSTPRHVVVNRALVGALGLLLVAAAGYWFGTRDRVTWSVQVDGAAEVVDWDADRVLVETVDDEVVLLDREDGAELATFALPDGGSIDQVSLVDDGFVVLTRRLDPDRDDPIILTRVADDGEERWQEQYADGARLLGVLDDAGTVALRSYGTTGRLLGLDLDSGEQRWQRRVSGRLPTPVSDGGLLRSVTVSLDGATDPAVVDLATGESLGTMTLELGKFDQVGYWRDVVLASQGDTLVRSVAGESASVDPQGVLSAPFLDDVDAGIVPIATGEDGVRGLSMETGEVSGEVTGLLSRVDLARVVRTYDGDDVVLHDLATGEEITRTEGPGVAALSRDGVLVARDPWGLTAFRHGLPSDQSAALVVVDLDGDEHGRWYGTSGGDQRRGGARRP